VTWFSRIFAVKPTVVVWQSGATTPTVDPSTLPAVVRAVQLLSTDIARLPIRVELKALGREDLERILTEPEASLIKQYRALLATEGVTLDFTSEGIAAIAQIAADTNATVENIGARRLQTVMERLLDEVSYLAPDRSGETVLIDRAYVDLHVGNLAKNADLSKFIL
jgi:ATP-dependent HslUV protease ATP-binding subunit HslU